MQMPGLVLIGTGPMAKEYARVLRARELPFKVVGRNSERTQRFAQSQGAVASLSLPNPAESVAQILEFGACDHFILATAPESLGLIAKNLILGGARRLLIEKPGALSSAELLALHGLAVDSNARALIAANRRGFASVRALAQEVADGGRDAVKSVHFDFTEWAHVIESCGKNRDVLAKWAIANSVHVIDTVRHLVGDLSVKHLQVSGQQDLEWHPAGSTFAGLAITEHEAPVTWSSCWVSGGRWGIWVRTRQGEWSLSPMESLGFRKTGTSSIEVIKTDDLLDDQFKPGLARVVDSFLDPLDQGWLPTLAEFSESLALVEQLVGYAQ